MKPEPTIDEIEGIIARTETIRAKWQGNAGYARQLEIELCGLRLLRDVAMLRDRMMETMTPC